MRVSSNSFTNQFLDQLRTLTARQNRLQLQAATGRRIQSADEDPAAARRVLDLQTEGSSNAQFLRNISTLGDQASASYGAMRGLKTISDRVTELATLADGTRSPDELRIYGREVNQLIQQAAQLANGKFNGDYLFSGTQTDQPPFAVTKDTDGNVTGVLYQGNQATTEADVASGTALSVRVPGANTTGTGAYGLLTESRTGADLFAHLVQFRDHLLAGNTTAVAATDRPALAKDEENLILQVGTNAAVQSRLEASGSVAAAHADAVDGLISKEADADLAQTLVQLNKTQTAYQAALQSGSSLMKLSLMDYIR